MKETKNELLQFVGGIVMLAVGLFIFSQKVIVHSSWFGYGGFSVAGIRISSGLVIVPLIIGIIWMFATSSFASKVFTAISVILILAAVILNTDIRLVTMSFGVLPVNRTIKNNKFLYRQPNYGWRYFYATFIY